VRRQQAGGACARDELEPQRLIGPVGPLPRVRLHRHHLFGDEAPRAILQLGLLKPKIAILDETDSGLDVDALRVVSEGVNRVRETGEVGTLLITHYTRILRYIKPDFVHVFSAGRIVESGGAELADKLENEGYEAYTKGGVSA
jgi:Fe-S cluster assembly ATP-binding protein